MKLFCAKGSAPPVAAAARLYGLLSGRQVEVDVCGQACVRGECAKEAGIHGFVPEVAARDYDLAIAGAEADMDDLEMAGKVAAGSRRSLGLRMATILVPAGNPAGITGLEDLARPGVRIGISTIDCLRGVWEDICGRAGCIPQVRQNISVRVTGCMALISAIAQRRVDAAIGWSSFAHSHPRIEALELPNDLRIFRATAAAVLEEARDPEGATRFLDYLCSEPGRLIFVHHGWIFAEDQWRATSQEERSCQLHVVG